MYLFTSETVSAGHPDKCADIIADTIVDTLLQLDADSKVATEVFISGKHIIIGGEVKTKVALDDSFYEEIALKALKKIGYPESGLCSRRGFRYGGQRRCAASQDRHPKAPGTPHRDRQSAGIRARR